MIQKMFSALIKGIQATQQARIARDLENMSDWQIKNLGLTRAELREMLWRQH